VLQLVVFLSDGAVELTTESPKDGSGADLSNPSQEQRVTLSANEDANETHPSAGSRQSALQSVDATSAVPPSGDGNAENSVTNDVIVGSSSSDASSKQPGGVVRQLMDISGTLSRFITLEYFSDGGALSQAFRQRY
jgi:hypothetical protein